LNIILKKKKPIIVTNLEKHQDGIEQIKLELENYDYDDWKPYIDYNQDNKCIIKFQSVESKEYTTEKFGEFWYRVPKPQMIIYKRG